MKEPVWTILDQGFAAVAKLSPPSATRVQRDVEDLVRPNDPDLPHSPVHPNHANRLQSHLVEWDGELKRLSAFELLAVHEPISRLRELIREFLGWRGVRDDAADRDA